MNKLAKEAVERQVVEDITDVVSTLNDENYADRVNRAVDVLIHESMLHAMKSGREPEELRALQRMQLLVLAMSLAITKRTDCTSFKATMVDDVIEFFRSNKAKVHVVVIGREEGPHGPGCTCPPEDEDDDGCQTKH